MGMLTAIRWRRHHNLLAVALLSLGLGLNVAVVSVLYGVLVRPLPMRDSDQLYLMWEAAPGHPELPLSLPVLKEWQRSRGCFAGTAGAAIALVTLRGPGGVPETEKAALVSRNFFGVLGVTPVAGKGLEGKATLETVLAEPLARDLFGTPESAIGKRLSLGNAEFSVAGVVPTAFRTPAGTQLWLPVDQGALLYPTLRGTFADPSARLFRGFVRISKDCKRGELLAQTEVVESSVDKNFPGRGNGIRARLEPLRARAVRSVEGRLWLFEGAALALLLLVAMNFALLRLARRSRLLRELGIRAALGASHGRLALEMLREALLLSLISGIGVLAVAYVALSVLQSLLPAYFPYRQFIRFDWPVALVALATGTLVVLLPTSLQLVTTARMEPIDTLRGRQGGGSGVLRGHTRMLALEVAAAIPLLLLCILFSTQLIELSRIDPGFESRHLSVASLSLPASQYESSAAKNAFYDRVLSDLDEDPATKSASAASDAPLEGFTCRAKLVEPPRDVPCLVVRPRFASALGAKLLAGRDLASRDAVKGSPGILVNRAFSKLVWPSRSPIGEDVKFADGRMARVVGEIENTRQDALENGLEATPGPALFLPGSMSNMTLLVRSSRPFDQEAARIRKAVARAAPGQAVYRLASGQSLLRKVSASVRLADFVASSMALVALLVACIGMFAIVSQLVWLRRRELAIEMALGASSGRVVWRVTHSAMISCLVGFVGGVAVFWSAIRVGSYLFQGVPPVSVRAVLASLVALLFVAFLAVLAPLLRVFSLDIVATLRPE